MWVCHNVTRDKAKITINKLKSHLALHFGTPGGKFQQNEIFSNPTPISTTSQRKGHCHGKRVVQWPFDHSCYCQMMMMIVSMSPQHYLGDHWPGWQLVSPDASDAGMQCQQQFTFQSRSNIFRAKLSILTCCSDMLLWHAWEMSGLDQSWPRVSADIASHNGAARPDQRKLGSLTPLEHRQPCHQPMVCLKGQQHIVSLPAAKGKVIVSACCFQGSPPLYFHRNTSWGNKVNCKVFILV